MLNDFISSIPNMEVRQELSNIVFQETVMYPACGSDLFPCAMLERGTLDSLDIKANSLANRIYLFCDSEPFTVPGYFNTDGKEYASWKWTDGQPQVIDFQLDDFVFAHYIKINIETKVCHILKFDCLFDSLLDIFSDYKIAIDRMFVWDRRGLLVWLDKSSIIPKWIMQNRAYNEHPFYQSRELEQAELEFVCQYRGVSSQDEVVRVYQFDQDAYEAYLAEMIEYEDDKKVLCFADVCRRYHIPIENLFPDNYELTVHRAELNIDDSISIESYTDYETRLSFKGCYLEVEQYDKLVEEIIIPDLAYTYGEWTKYKHSYINRIRELLGISE